MPWLHRFATVLAHPRWPWLAALVGVALASPSLGAGLQLDDYLHRLAIQLHLQGEGVGWWWDLYVAADGDSELLRQRMDKGFAPWWVVPELRVRFWRPLSAATHVLDYGCWPNEAWLMHAHSLLWSAGLVVAVGALFRRWLGPTWVAGLATLLFAIDDAHGTPIGWIAQRNALVSALLVTLTLIAHDRHRRDGWSPGRWLGPVCFLLALLGAEASVAALGYLLAFAWWLDPGVRAQSGLRRASRAATTLLPYVVILIGWRWLYDNLGYGAQGSGIYLDPVREPGVFIAALPDRMASLLLGQLGWSPSDRWLTGSTLGIPLLAWGVLVVTVLGLAVRPRLARQPGVLVCLVGSVLALVPAAAVAPTDRMLLLVGVGAHGVVASVFAAALDEGRTPYQRALYVLVAIPLIFIHGILAPLRRPATVGTFPDRLEQLMREGIETLPDDPVLTEQDLVVVNAPPTFAGVSLWLSRWGTEHALPRRLWMLGATSGPVIVRRVDAHTLHLQPVGGYLADPWSAMVRGDAHPFAIGDHIDLSDLRIEVLGVAQGRPTVVEARFSRPLEEASLRWSVWRGERFEPFVLPAVGSSAAIPASPR